MLWPRRLSPPILIVCWILLAAASPTIAPSPLKTVQPENKAAAPNTTNAQSKTPSAISTHGDTISTDEQNEAQNQSIPVRIVDAHRDIYDVGFLIFTAVLVITGCFQARSAWLSHKANRPYLAVEDFELVNFTTLNRLDKANDVMGLRIMLINFKVRNVGKGAALITDGKAIIKIVPSRGNAFPRPIDDFGDYCDLYGLRIESGGLISPDHFVRAQILFQGGLLTDETYLAVRTYEQHLVTYGIIKYRSLTQRLRGYEMGFGMTYWAEGLTNEAHFERGPIKYNYSK